MYKTYTEKQLRWEKNKANWEQMTVKQVRKVWSAPPDSELTPCGCSVCYGCEICVGSN